MQDIRAMLEEIREARAECREALTRLDHGLGGMFAAAREALRRLEQCQGVDGGDACASSGRSMRRCG